MAIDNDTANEAVIAAFAADDLVTEKGERDLVKMRARIFEAVYKAKALNKAERVVRAITRGALVAHVFPSLPGPDTYGEEDDQEARDMAAEVYKRISAAVWSAASDVPTSPVQRLVGIGMGNGYVLCRTKIGPDQVEAVYVTDDLECIRLDFTRPDNESLEAKIKKSTAKREMLVLRQPHNARTYASELGKTLKTATAVSSAQMQMALDAVKERLVDDEPDGDES